MRLIDVDELKPDAEYNAWDGEFTAFSVKQIEEAPTVEGKASGDYIKREDAIERLNQLYHSYEVEAWLNSLPTIEISEETEGELRKPTRKTSERERLKQKKDLYLCRGVE